MTSTRRLALFGASLLAVWLSLAAGMPARAAETVVELPTRPGVTQAFLGTPVQGKPVATVILLPGSPGTLFKRNGSGQIQRDPRGAPLIYGGNFLIRTRHAFAAAGFLVFSVDVPSDHLGGVDAFRGTAEHAQDIAAVIAYARQQAPVPVWLVGTSMGTISAANAAARLKTGGPDGLVLTSSMTAPTKRSQPINAVVDVGAITVPTLFVHNKEDGCVAATFGGVAPLMEQFKHATRKELIAVSGGSPPQSDPCEALSRHGYLGIEDEVVGDIARWIKSAR
jgi:pimeloyl-ACP methyl ester carboxylesterase